MMTNLTRVCQGDLKPCCLTVQAPHNTNIDRLDPPQPKNRNNPILLNDKDTMLVKAVYQIPFNHSILSPRAVISITADQAGMASHFKLTIHYNLLASWHLHLTPVMFTLSL